MSRKRRLFLYFTTQPLFLPGRIYANGIFVAFSFGQLTITHVTRVTEDHLIVAPTCYHSCDLESSLFWLVSLTMFFSIQHCCRTLDDSMFRLFRKYSSKSWIKLFYIEFYRVWVLRKKINGRWWIIKWWLLNWAEIAILFEVLKSWSLKVFSLKKSYKINLI